MGAAVNIINAILGAGSLGIGIADSVMSAQIAGYTKKIKELSDQNKSLLNSSDQFINLVNIITSPLLQIQNDKSDIALAANVQSIREYVEFLKKFLLKDQQSIKQLSTICKNLPGSNLTLTIINYTLLGLFSVFSAYSFYKLAKQYKQYRAKKQGTTQEPPQLPPSDVNKEKFIQEAATENSVANELIKNTASSPKELQNIIQIASTSNNPMANNLVKQSKLGRFKVAIKNVGKSFSQCYAKNKKIFKVVGKGIGLAVSVAGFALSIYSIVETKKSLEEAQKNYEDMVAKFDQLYLSCAEMLYHMNAFMDSLYEQILSFAIYLNEVKSIVRQNILVSNDPNALLQGIKSLQFPHLNAQTTNEISKAKTKMFLALSEMNIVQSPSTVKAGEFVYTVNQSREKTTQQFNTATGIIDDLNTKIGIVDIFNNFYKLLTKSKELLQHTTYKDTTKLATLVETIKSDVKYNNKLAQLEDHYCTSMGIDISQMQQSDRYKLAQIISFSTKVYPTDTTNSVLYGNYNLNSFEMKEFQANPISTTTQMQDVKIDQIMGDWPGSKKEESVRKIVEAANINASDLKYESSSIYIQNTGQLDKQDWLNAKVQVFGKGSGQYYQKYYVLYDSVTDLFIRVSQGTIKGTIQHSTNEVPKKPQEPRQDTLLPGGKLFVNMYLKSQNGQYYAVMQQGGNFVVYKGSKFLAEYAVWSSGSYRGSDSYTLTMQYDGNLVMYDGKGKAIWNSSTWRKDPPNYYLTLSNEGNLIILDSNKTQTAWAWVAIAWKSSLSHGESLRNGDYIRSPNQLYNAVMQQDGNFVVYKGGAFSGPQNAIWSTNTNRQPSTFELIMQTDGNLVLYDNNKIALWSSQTWNQTPVNRHLSLLESGKLVVLDQNYVQVWSS